MLMILWNNNYSSGRADVTKTSFLCLFDSFPFLCFLQRFVSFFSLLFCVIISSVFSLIHWTLSSLSLTHVLAFVLACSWSGCNEWTGRLTDFPSSSSSLSSFSCIEWRWRAIYLELRLVLFPHHQHHPFLVVVRRQKSLYDIVFDVIVGDHFSLCFRDSFTSVHFVGSKICLPSSSSSSSCSHSIVSANSDKNVKWCCCSGQVLSSLMEKNREKRMISLMPLVFLLFSSCFPFPSFCSLLFPTKVLPSSCFYPGKQYFASFHGKEGKGIKEMME